MRRESRTRRPRRPRRAEPRAARASRGPGLEPSAVALPGRLSRVPGRSASRRRRRRAGRGPGRQAPPARDRRPHDHGIAYSAATWWAWAGSRACCADSAARSPSTASSASSRRWRQARNRAQAIPRRGAKSSETATNPVATRTIVGPVAVWAVVLITEPATPAAAPSTADRITITPRRSVHWRAAAPGATTMALISTTPTVLSPTTMAITSRLVSSTSSRRTGNPIEAAKSGLKLSSLNSFQSTSRISTATAPTAAMVITSTSSSAAAWPKRYRSSPALPAAGCR